MRILLIILILSTNSFAQISIQGKWTTIDDNSGEARSLVEITELDQKFLGKLSSCILTRTRTLIRSVINAPKMMSVTIKKSSDWR